MRSCADADQRAAEVRSPAEPSSVPVRQGELRVYARDDDTRIKIVIDGSAIADGRLFDVAFFADGDQATLAATACVHFLEKTPADEAGWHPFPARHVPQLLAAARNTAWAGVPVPAKIEQLAPTVVAPTPVVLANQRRPWTREREAWAVFLAGKGFTAKQIADDPLVNSTEAAVYKRLVRLGIWLSDAPQGQVSFQLPVRATVVIDKAAGAVNLTRSAFLRRYVLQGVAQPARFGLVAVSA